MSSRGTWGSAEGGASQAMAHSKAKVHWDLAGQAAAWPRTGSKGRGEDQQEAGESREVLCAENIPSCCHDEKHGEGRGHWGFQSHEMHSCWQWV